MVSDNGILRFEQFLSELSFHSSRIDIGRQALNQLFIRTSVHNSHIKSRYYQKNYKDDTFN